MAPTSNSRSVDSRCVKLNLEFSDTRSERTLLSQCFVLSGYMVAAPPSVAVI